MKDPTCAKCHQPILWTVTAAGARQPLDPKPENRVVIKPNPDDPLTPLSRVVATFMPHHASCPVLRAEREAAAKARAETEAAAATEEPVT